ncbi:MAG: hypothetical protein ACLUOF_04860 [Ruminococcus sp.]
MRKCTCRSASNARQKGCSGSGTDPNYQKLHRATFQLTPSAPSPAFCPDEVDESPACRTFTESCKGFPNLLEYSLWLTDVSHRCRHGMSKVLTYKNKLHADSGIRLERQCSGTGCDQLAQRGSGYARDFLRWIAGKLAAEGKQAALFALDVRISFYREIGFREIASGIRAGRRDIPKTARKGAL